MEKEQLMEWGLDEAQSDRILTQLESESAKLRGDYEQKLSQERLDGALTCALLKSGAREPKTVLALLEREKITLKDGKLCGLDDQLAAIRRQSGYLFAGTDGVLVDSGAPHGDSPRTAPQTLRGALLDYYGK